MGVDGQEVMLGLGTLTTDRSAPSSSAPSRNRARSSVKLAAAPSGPGRLGPRILKKRHRASLGPPYVVVCASARRN